MTIDNFITSKTRIKILKQFIFNPNSSFHIRELVRILKDEVNAVRRELINLEHAGFVKSQKQSNKICYVLDTSFELLTELGALFHKEFALGGQMLKNKRQLGNVYCAILTYTFLTLAPSSAEDLDLIIVGEPDERILEAIVKNAEDELKRDIYYTIMTERDWDSRKRRRDTQTLSAMLLPHVLLMGDPTTVFI